MAARLLSKDCRGQKVPCASLEGVYKVLGAIDHAAAQEDWGTVRDLCKAARRMIVGACTCE